MSKPKTVPPCEKCGRKLTDDLRCPPCGREYTNLWVFMRLRGER